MRKLVGDYDDFIQQKDEIGVDFDFENFSNRAINFTVKIKGEDGQYFFSSSSSAAEVIVPKGSFTLTMKIPSNFFNEGVFFVDTLVVENKQSSIIQLKDVCSFNVNPDPKPLGAWMGKSEGYVKPILTWEEKQS